MATEELKIHDVFRLSNGVTVIACQKPQKQYNWTNRKVILRSASKGSSAEIVISGEAILRGKSKMNDQIAIETKAEMALSTDDVTRTAWTLQP